MRGVEIEFYYPAKRKSYIIFNDMSFNSLQLYVTSQKLKLQPILHKSIGTKDLSDELIIVTM